MKPSKERKIQEAVKRMKAMQLHPDAIKQFEKQGLINFSQPPFGGLYWVEDEDLCILREWEQKNNGVVYHVIRSYTEFGVLDSYFYVSDYENEWQADMHDLGIGEALVWVRNNDDPECSEFGYIGFKRTPAAGLLRVW